MKNIGKTFETLDPYNGTKKTKQHQIDTLVTKGPQSITQYKET